MGRKKSKSELPDWFDIANYHAAKDLDLVGWYHQFYKRYLVYSKPIYKDWKDSKELAEIRKSGIVEYNKKDPFCDNFGLMPIFNGTMGLPEEQRKSVRLATTREIALAMIQNPDLNKKQIVSILENLSSSTFDVTLSGLPHNTPPLWEKMTGNLLISIDINQPRKKIEEDFLSLLTIMRDKYLPAKKSRLNLDPSDWVDKAVLPYIDLHFWAEETGVKISLPQMMQTIFPADYDKDQESFRKNIEPKYKDYISEWFLTSLASEIARQSTGN